MAYYRSDARKNGLKGFNVKFKLGMDVINRSFDPNSIPDIVKGELLTRDANGLVAKADNASLSIELLFTPQLNDKKDNSFSSHSSSSVACYKGHGIVETWLFDPAGTYNVNTELTAKQIDYFGDGVLHSVFAPATLGDKVFGIVEDGAADDGAIIVEVFATPYTAA